MSPDSGKNGNRSLNPVVAMPTTSFLKLSLFVAGDPADTPTAAIARSQRRFADGAVGLGIVAALNGSGGGVRGRPSALTRSKPIPIAPVRALAAPPSPEPEEGELSESYTCVISHVGANSVRKRVYFGDGSEVVTVDVRRDREVLFMTPSPLIPPRKPVNPFATMVLSSHCHLCMKKLEGIDIYMYRYSLLLLFFCSCFLGCYYYSMILGGFYAWCLFCKLVCDSSYLRKFCSSVGVPITELPWFFRSSY